MIGTFGSEMDLNRMSIQICMRLGARQRDGIDVRSDDEASTASPRDPGKHSRTGTYVQNRLRLALPA